MQPSTMFARFFQAVPGLHLLGKNTASLRFNSDGVRRGNTRTSSTWGDERGQCQSTTQPRIKTQTYPVFREGEAQWGTVL